MAANFSEEFVDVGGSKVQLLKGGAGEPLLLLHGAGGNPGALRYAQALADRYTVYMPSHPGFGQSERPDWLENMSDLACFYNWFLEKQGLDGARCIGFSLGGYLAAEMAVACHHSFSKLMLVDPVGIKPNVGEITDIFIISPAQILEMLFHDPKQSPEYDQLYGQEPTPEQALIAERNREMSVRLIWKPYAHDPRLPSLLARVGIPTQIVWGRQDQIIPLECGHMYQKAIPNSKLTVIDNCGHVPHVEKPDEFVKVAMDFLA